MLTVLILLIEAISPIDAALPHLRTLPEAQRFQALLPLLSARPELLKEAQALAQSEAQRAALKALLPPQPEGATPRQASSRPSLPEWAARLEPNPEALKAGDVHEQLQLVKVYYWRGARAEAIAALRQMEIRGGASEWLEWAARLRAWPLALNHIKAADLDLEERLQVLGELGEALYEAREWSRLSKIADVMAASDYSHAEEAERKAEEAEAMGEEELDKEEAQEAAREKVEEAKERADTKRTLIRDALRELARTCAERAPKSAARAAGLMDSEREAEAQAEIVSDLLQHEHLEVAARLARTISDPFPVDEGCEGDECGGAVEPELIGTSARIEVISAALNEDWGLAWGMFKGLDLSVQSALLWDDYQTIAAEVLPVAIERHRLKALLRLTEPLKIHGQGWEAEIIRALIEAEQIGPALERLEQLKDRTQRLTLLAKLALKMEQLGLSAALLKAP